MTTDDWVELHGETRADQAPTNLDETVKCSQCGARVEAEATRLCEQSGCENPVCGACEREGLLVLERGVLTCGSCSAR